MSARFKRGDKVRCVETWTAHVVDRGSEYAVRDVDPIAGKVLVNGEWIPDRYFEDAEPEYVVGQQVSGDDYARLPVGSVARRAAGPEWVKTADGDWHLQGGDHTWGPSRRPVQRTLIHLPDATEPEDKDDLYVEPEPLTEPSVDNSEDLTEPEDADDVESEPLHEGQWVQVWAQVRDPEPDPDGDFRLHIRRLQTEDTTYTNAYAHPDAIVRPDAGQVPPWLVESAKSEAEELAEVIGCEHHGAQYGVCSVCVEMAERAIDAGWRRTEDGAS